MVSVLELAPEDAATTEISVVEAPGQFAIRGGLMDIYPSTRPRPTRIELFGDEVESLREFDLAPFLRLRHA